MPKVSVIVPVYKVEKFLPRCLDSIVNQTLEDIEIICINDGSPDNSLQILEEYAKKDSRIKIINQENAGLSVARNVGMEIAQGEYIGFVDSDDWIDVEFYEKLYTTAKKYDADIGVCSVQSVRKFGRKNYLFKYKSEELAEDTYKKYYLCDIPCVGYVWNKIYRTSDIKKFNIMFEPGVYFEDVCFLLESLYNLKRLVTVPEVKYYYQRDNAGSILRLKSQKIKDDSAHVHERMLEFFKSQNLTLPNYCRPVKKYKFLGLTLVKIRYHSAKRECSLLNIIKFNLPPIKNCEEK